MIGCIAGASPFARGFELTGTRGARVIGDEAKKHGAVVESVVGLAAQIGIAHVDIEGAIADLTPVLLRIGGRSTLGFCHEQR